MSKTLKNNHYLTEYSASFIWKDQNKNEAHRSSLTRNEITDQSLKSPVLNDRKLHQFRHRLKLALLEKLEKLESTYSLNNSENFDQSSIMSSKPSRKKISHGKAKIVQAHSPNTISESNYQKNHKNRKLKSKNGVAIDGWRQELQRSRSMAMEFKHKNESTQIWWLNESLDSSSETKETHYDHLARLVRNTPTADKSDRRLSLSRGSVHALSKNDKMSGRHPMISAKISTAEPSQSTFSRSSVSYQIAQATGYQSTTDEMSSFNHDTDCRSVDPILAKRKMSNPISSTVNNEEYEDVEVTKLDLGDEVEENAYSTIRRGPLQFYAPYQTEDFNKDTSSDSNIRNSVNYDTYRLD